jgi:hypothetical protein
MYGYLPTDDLACLVVPYGMPALRETVNHAIVGANTRETGNW